MNFRSVIMAARPRITAYHLRLAGEISALVVTAVFVGYLMQRLHHANLSLLFLLVVLITAARHGLWPSIASSVLGFLAFNFFFTVPYGTFLVSEDGDIATLVFFLAVAILSGNLASRMRTALTRRDQALERISNLYDFSHRVAGTASASQVLQTLVDHLSGTLEAATAVLYRDEKNRPKTAAASRKPYAATREDLDALRALERGAGGESGTGDWRVLDIDLPELPHGQLAVHRASLSSEQSDLIRTLCKQTEVSLDRIRLAEDLDRSRRESERDRLRSALLTSVSHDLRTPLASIIGAASTVKEFGGSISSGDSAELIQTVLDEARRLNGYIQNLLDMTRIEHGELKISCEWEDLNDLVGTSIRRLREAWPDAEISTNTTAGPGLIFVHGELFEQALHNVLDNAVRYSPPGAPVEIQCSQPAGRLQISVIDRGPGLPPAERERVFDMFYRSEAGDSRSGTGLGLAITRGIMQAHGGNAVAEAGPGDRGTKIVLEVPQPPVPGLAATD